MTDMEKKAWYCWGAAGVWAIVGCIFIEGAPLPLPVFAGSVWLTISALILSQR